MNVKMKSELFLNQLCKVTYLSGFVIDGTVIDVDETGIIFKTSTQTSFISWNTIKDIKVV